MSVYIMYILQVTVFVVYTKFSWFNYFSLEPMSWRNKREAERETVGVRVKKRVCTFTVLHSVCHMVLRVLKTTFEGFLIKIVWVDKYSYLQWCEYKRKKIARTHAACTRRERYRGVGGRFSKYHVHVAFDKLKLSIAMAIWYTHFTQSQWPFYAAHTHTRTLAFKTHLFSPIAISTAYRLPSSPLSHSQYLFSIPFTHSVSL